MAIYSQAEATLALSSLPDWRLESGELRRRFLFTDFREAMSFVNAVAKISEEAGHHPDIDIRYNKVDLALTSHDAGGITETDFRVAAQIGSIL